MRCPACATECAKDARFCAACGGALAGAEPPRVGATVHGYRIERKVGSGGMGEVFLATQLELDRPVALKVLSAECSADTALIERFKREARALAKLEHPHIVGVYDMFVAGGAFTIALTWCPGGSVRDQLGAAGLPEKEALRLARETALGLWAAAEQGIVHRDIKPDNLLLTEAGAVKIADFGLVKRAEEAGAALTVRGTFLGTPAYMSPEQCQDSASSDHRSDLYSLGCSLYVMLTGKPPFPGPALVNFLKQHVADPPPGLEGTASAKTAAIVARLLAKDPAARFPDGGALAKALAEAEEALAADAGPPPLPAAGGGDPGAPRPSGGPSRGLVVGLVLLGLALLAAGWYAWPPPPSPPPPDTTEVPAESDEAWAARLGIPVVVPDTRALHERREALLASVRAQRAALPPDDGLTRILGWGLEASEELLVGWDASLRWTPAEARAEREALEDALARAERNLDEWLARNAGPEVRALREDLRRYRAELSARLAALER